jgi:hypothetical protein
LAACVKWINTLNYKIHVGLAFTQGPLLPGTILDQYFDRVLLAPGSLDASVPRPGRRCWVRCDVR